MNNPIELIDFVFRLLGSKYIYYKIVYVFFQLITTLQMKFQNNIYITIIQQFNYE